MLQQPMQGIFGIDNMDTPEFKEVLDGTYQCPKQCIAYLQKLLLDLQCPTDLIPIPMRSYEEYKWRWKIARETMASSPSAVHFGHYMAGITKDTVGKINAILANVRLLSGMTPERWKQTLKVMLEKLAGNDNVEKLQIIMLFEANFNNNNKWLGRVMMQIAEENNLLAPEQYRSWKYKSAIIQCLNKRLFYNYHQFMQFPAALCSNDAKSCYDRIVLIIVALCLCQLGAPYNVVKSMIHTLAHLNYHVQTAFGNSEATQGYDTWQEGVAGIGQGNRAGPHIWAVVSTPLFDIMQQEGLIACFICACSHQHNVLAGLAFIDDTDLIINDASNLKNVVKDKIQCLLLMWHGLLRAKGGNLVPDKSFWYLIDFKWQN